MPILQWIGKDKVINHHQDVPLRVLDQTYGYGEADGVDENKIIHGDNLEALKALLPEYEGRISCVYIDPPYNTGNEGWVYNDNVNDPRIAKWIGEVVGAEGEDLSRHDKWLCMMYPRLRLLQKLLSDDGAIFISIDENECAGLKFICDEIFGANCFVSNVSWQRTYSTRNDAKGIVNEAEHVLVYGKRSGWQPNRLPRTEEMNAAYKNPDGDIEPWASDNPFAPGASTHQGMVYAIQHPLTGELIYPPAGRCWTFSQEQMLEIMNGWCSYELRQLDDSAKRAAICGVDEFSIRSGVTAIMISGELNAARAEAQRILETGPWPRFYFTKNGLGGIRRKTYLSAVGGIPPTNLWMYADVGHTDEATKEQKRIFGNRSPFDTPKPTRLIERVLQIAADRNSIVLDSFAGSGTTAHAVLNANKADSGNRHFILVEMMDYAESITAERVRRVIDGYGEGKKAVEGTGGSFSFYELGEPMFKEDGNLNEVAGAERIRAYVWYSETGRAYEANASDHPYHLGNSNGTGYYFCYEPDGMTTLDYGFLSTIADKQDGYVIYADMCAISDDELAEFGIAFKKIPRDIARL